MKIGGRLNQIVHQTLNFIAQYSPAYQKSQSQLSETDQQNQKLRTQTQTLTQKLQHTKSQLSETNQHLEQTQFELKTLEAKLSDSEQKRTSLEIQNKRLNQRYETSLQLRRQITNYQEALKHITIEMLRAGGSIKSFSPSELEALLPKDYKFIREQLEREIEENTFLKENQLMITINALSRVYKEFRAHPILVLDSSGDKLYESGKLERRNISEEIMGAIKRGEKEIELERYDIQIHDIYSKERLIGRLAIAHPGKAYRDKKWYTKASKLAQRRTQDLLNLFRETFNTPQVSI